ncbi:MAG: DinB family protein [Planctomycetota bacterium]
MVQSLARDPRFSPCVGVFLAQLDDQLRRMHAFLEGWKVSHLEWQAKPGRNSAGMLLTHLAITELVWMHLANGGARDTREARVRATLGISLEEDGIPLPPDGRHAGELSGRTVDEYLGWLDRARAATHEIAGAWSDEDLERTFVVNQHEFTREWVLYHLVEHFAAHFGQIALLGHMMRDNKGKVPYRET